MSRYYFICGIVFSTTLILASPAYAYIDMGTGSMIFQMLAAGIVGFIFTIKMYWFSLKQKVSALLAKLTGKPVVTQEKNLDHGQDGKG